MEKFKFYGPPQWDELKSALEGSVEQLNILMERAAMAGVEVKLYVRDRSVLGSFFPIPALEIAARYRLL